VFVGTADSIANAKLLLDYNLAHLKVSNKSLVQTMDVFTTFYMHCKGPLDRSLNIKTMEVDGTRHRASY